MNFLTFLFRIIVGLVFVLSGFLKAIDPLGSCYKFTDYFNLAFDMPSLAQFSLPLAFILAALEFTTGIMLIFKLKPKIAIWLSLIFMVVFTPLTLYIWLKNPVHDCGCFGDCLVMTNFETFLKNCVLIIMVIFLVCRRKHIDNPLDDRAELGIAVAVFCMALIFQHVMLRHLPIIDCRPYKIGNNIAEKMAIPEGAKRDVFETIIIYKNSETGQVKEFNADNCPWDDSTWVWQDTKSKLVEKGFIPEVHDFTINDSSNQDFTDQVLNLEKPVLLVVCHKLEQSEVNGLDMIHELQSYAEKKDYVIIGLTSSTWDVVDAVKNEYSIDFPFFQTDDITLKTMVRANPGIMKLEKGTVTGKWNYRDFKFNKNY